MELKIEFNSLQICSTNQLKYAKGAYTTKYRRCREALWDQLCNYKARIEMFRRGYEKLPKSDKKLKVDITYTWPKEYLWTKDGKISRRSLDLDNTLKGILDAMFNGKFEDRMTIAGNTVSTIGIDDQFITTLNVKKRSCDKLKGKFPDITIIISIDSF